MKKDFKEKFNKLLLSMKLEEAKGFLGQTYGNHAATQERLMKLRMRLLGLIVIFYLVSRDLFKISNIPGLGGEITEDSFLLLQLSSLNDLVLCVVPLIFSYTYFLMIANLIYRSQHRYMHRRIYERFHTQIFKANFHLFTYPQKSPGHILKVLSRIGQKDLETEEEITANKQANSTAWKETTPVGTLRMLGIWLERLSHWVMIGWFLSVVWARCYSQNEWIVLLLTLICLIIFGYALYLIIHYNNYFQKPKADTAEAV